MINIFLRNIFFLAVFIPCTFIISSLVIICAYLPKTGKIIRFLENIWSKSTVFAAGIKPKIEGASLDAQKNYIFVSNHQSYLDIPVMLAVFSHYFPRCLAKESLFKIPFFGPGMRRTGHLPINRENVRRGMQCIQNAVQELQKGSSLLVFPEGSRNEDVKDIQEFQTGAFIIAIKSGLPLVPVVISGTGRLMPKGSIFLHESEVKMRVLPPVIIDENYSLKQREKLKDDIWETMQSHYAQLVG